MKWLAKHVILGVEIQILEVVEAENLAGATELLANKMAKSTALRVGYDPERGVVVIHSPGNGPNDGAIISNYPEAG